MTTNGNGVKKERTPLRAGVYSPTMTFFDPETEELDVPTIKKHAVRLAEAGLVGLVTMGSNGEAVHLSRAEKQTVTRATREALDEAGYKDVPVIVGASEHGIKLTIELAKEAAEAGGEYILTVPPSYYRYAIDEEAISTRLPTHRPCPSSFTTTQALFPGLTSIRTFSSSWASTPISSAQSSLVAAQES
jgi:L-threo-3-deoxy-hexylosonate aldolase